MNYFRSLMERVYFEEKNSRLTGANKILVSYKLPFPFVS